MADTAVLEQRAKMHPEEAETVAQADAAAAAKVKAKKEDPKPPAVDDRGRQLTFEDVPVEEIDSRIVGDFKVELPYIRKSRIVRFEGVARLDEVAFKTIKRGKVRTEVRKQQFYVEHVIAWEDGPGGSRPANIDELLAAALEQSDG